MNSIFLLVMLLAIQLSSKCNSNPLLEGDNNNKSREGSKETPDGNATSIHECCINGDLDGLKACIEACTSKSKKKELINSKDSNGNTPLHLAAANGKLDIIKYLYTCENITLNVKNTDNKDALLLAVENGHLDVLEFFITEIPAGKKRPICSKKRKKELVELAKTHGHEDIVKFLTDNSYKPVADNNDTSGDHDEEQGKKADNQAIIDNNVSDSNNTSNDNNMGGDDEDNENLNDQNLFDQNAPSPSTPSPSTPSSSSSTSSAAQNNLAGHNAPSNQAAQQVNEASIGSDSEIFQHCINGDLDVLKACIEACKPNSKKKELLNSKAST